ncbi:MAG TPA: M12 family metallo-peptidase, partial [Thermoanaerobaculia bacterium]|nr:M12 family metallo-peptidase [Thermoanaerobaculia bacterium]
MRLPFSSLVRSVGMFLLAAGLCTTLSAATVSKLNDDVLSPLRDSVGAKQIHLNNVPLYAHGTVKIDLEEFQVWAPGGKVIVDDGKSVTYLDPPPMRFFRGMVNGDPESFAYFSVDGTTGAISALIATRDGKFAIDASRRRATPKPGRAIDGDFDYFLTAMDASDETPMTGQTWSCGVEKLPALPRVNQRLLTATDAKNHQVIAQGISGTQAYAITVEVETDSELYINAGSNSTTLTNYVTNLTGAVSTIYNRDIHTNVVQQNLHIYTGGNGSDPWAATDANSGLNELGDYYHTNHLSLKRSAVVMLSGKATNSGVAWEGVVGEGDFSNSGDFGGAYAWCGSIGDLGGQGIGSVPDPNATNNGTLYGMPTGGNNYWPLEEYAHELGHNLAGHHTHCVVITSGEAAGTNHPSQLFIDMCFTGEIDQDGLGNTSACATGAQYSSAPTEKGTIMSYCHNVFQGQVPQSRYTLGQASEVSHHELDDYMLRAAGPLGPYGGTSNIVTAVGTFSMSTITASSSVPASSTGNTASVTPSNGTTVTYAWTITGGTITSATNTASITYTAGASGSVVLRATAYNTKGNNGEGFPAGTVGVTDTKTVTIVTVSPPTNVVATALTSTSVQVTWTA